MATVAVRASVSARGARDARGTNEWPIHHDASRSGRGTLEARANGVRWRDDARDARDDWRTHRWMDRWILAQVWERVADDEGRGRRRRRGWRTGRRWRCDERGRGWRGDAMRSSVERGGVVRWMRW